MTGILKGILWGGLFAGTVALLPMAARGDTDADRSSAATAGIVDHETLEARGAGAVTIGDDTAEMVGGVADHATAEARGETPATATLSEDATAAVPDHAAAEARTHAPRADAVR